MAADGTILSQMFHPPLPEVAEIQEEADGMTLIHSMTVIIAAATSRDDLRRHEEATTMEDDGEMDHHLHVNDGPLMIDEITTTFGEVGDENAKIIMISIIEVVVIDLEITTTRNERTGMARGLNVKSI